ncbi:uncharacterized protein METZ01_LOCUS38772 [marine metagenome]|uniref:Uncharacterized protein n=1 Tax=marine metagenome TaxID=408172 RepID=A0A381R4Y3_9ZZZZ
MRSGLFKILANSKADCHRFEADPIFTWFKRSSALFVSKVIKRNKRKNTAPKTAIMNGIKKKE